jgi:hypothetical protein
VPGLLIVIYAGLTGLDDSVRLEAMIILLPCADAIRIAAGSTLADVRHARGWREGLAFQWLFTTVFAFVGPFLLMSESTAQMQST